MADIELARAFVEIIPVTKGISKKTQEEIFPGRAPAEDAAKKSGNAFTSRLGSVLKKTALGVGLAAGGVLATSLVKGFGRLSAIENAEAKLKGLGNSATDVASIMDNALGAVKGTAFGMDEAATTAASAVAAGIKPGQELEGYLRLVGDAATIAGTDMSSMGSIFNKVATSGKVQGDVLNQLGDKGIPIVTMLAEQMGVSAEEVYKLGSAGKIGTEDFLAAMSSMSGAALEGGNTTSGAFKNMGAALSRFGATLLTGVYPLIGPFFNEITALIDGAAETVTPFIESITPKLQAAATSVLGFVSTFTGSLGGILEVFRSGDFDPEKWADGISEDSPLVTVAFAIRDAWITVRDTMTPVLASVRDGIVAAIPYVQSLWSWFSELSNGAKALFGGAVLTGGLAAFGQLGATFGLVAGKVKGLMGPLGKFAPLLRFMVGPVGLIVGGLVALIATNDEVRSSFGALFEVLSDVVGTTLSTLAPVIADLAVQLGPVLGAAALAVGSALQALAPVVVWVVDGVASLLQWLQPAMPILVGVAAAVFGLVKVFGVLAPIFVKVFGIVTRVIGVVSKIGPLMAAISGPVGWIIIGITALGVALWAFFTKTETGRQLWAKIWGGIKDAVAVVVDWIMGTAWPAIQTAWAAIAAGALWLYQNAILPAWQGIRLAIGAVGDWITGTLWPAMQAAWQGIAASAMWLWHNVITPVWTGIKIAIAVAVAVILTYIDLLKWYFSNVIAPVALWLWHNVISPVWAGIQAAIGAVVNWMVNTAWPLIKAAWDAIAAGAIWLWQNVLVPAWSGIQTAIAAVVNWLTGTAWPFIKSVWDAISTSVTWLWQNVIVPVWAGIQAAISAVVSWLQNTAWPAIQTVIGWLQMSFEGWKLIAQTVWDAVQAAIRAVVDWFQNTAWPLLSSVIESIKTGFTTLRDSLQAAWSFIKDNIIAPVVNWFRDTVKPIFDTVTDGIGDAFTLLKDTISTAWTAIQDAAKAPIKFVVETVVNDALIKNFNKVASKIGVDTLDEVSLPTGFARGGVLPGMSSYRNGDDQLVPMRRGEGVIVSEALRDPASRSLIHGINRAALSGGSSLASLMGGEGFAGGGILGDAWRGAKSLAGDALDKVLDGVDFVAEALKDPSSIFTKVYDSVVGNMPGVGAVLDVAKGAGKDILDGVIAKVLGSLGPSGDVDQPGVSVSGEGWSRAANAASALGLTMTSSTRSGARTAGSGMVSLHALGRARDYAGSGSAMRAFFNTMDAAPYPTELLYSPMGGRNLHRSGRRYANTGATRSNHFSHVHVGFNKGGVYDNGGWLPPGGAAVNMSNRPEPVFSGAQWDLLAQGFEERSSQGNDASGVLQLSAEDKELLREIGNMKLVMDRRELASAVRDSQAMNRRMGARP